MGEADEDNHRAGDNRGEETHHPLDAHQLDNARQRQVEQPGHHNAAAGIGQLFCLGEAGKLAGFQGLYRSEAAQEGKGGTQEGRHFELAQEMEQQRPHPGAEQRGLDAEACDNRHQDSGPKHGEHVLQAQQQHLWQAELPGIPYRFDAHSCSFFAHQ